VNGGEKEEHLCTMAATTTTTQLDDVCNNVEKTCSFAALSLLSWIECVRVGDSSNEVEFATFNLVTNWRDPSILDAAMKKAPSEEIASEVPKRFIPRVLLHNVTSKCEQSDTSLGSTSISEHRKSGPFTVESSLESLLTGANASTSPGTKHDSLQVLTDIIALCDDHFKENAEEDDIFASLCQHLECLVKQRVAGGGGRGTPKGRKELEKKHGEKFCLVEVMSDNHAATNDETKLLANHPLEKVSPFCIIGEYLSFTNHFVERSCPKCQGKKVVEGISLQTILS
jgi:hypothetical protein